MWRGCGGPWSTCPPPELVGYHFNDLQNGLEIESEQVETTDHDHNEQSQDDGLEIPGVMKKPYAPFEGIPCSYPQRDRWLVPLLKFFLCFLFQMPVCCTTQH